MEKVNYNDFYKYLVSACSVIVVAIIVTPFVTASYLLNIFTKLDELEVKYPEQKMIVASGKAVVRICIDYLPLLVLVLLILSLSGLMYGLIK